MALGFSVQLLFNLGPRDGLCFTILDPAIAVERVDDICFRVLHGNLGREMSKKNTLVTLLLYSLVPSQVLGWLIAARLLISWAPPPSAILKAEAKQPGRES